MKDLWYIRSRADESETGSIKAVSCPDIRALLAERDALLEALKLLESAATHMQIVRDNQEYTMMESDWGRIATNAEAARAAIIKAESEA